LFSKYVNQGACVSLPFVLKAVVTSWGASMSTAKPAAKKAAADTSAVAHKGQRTGPQPAKYLDPKTGATWSGRGPAPAWLAAAKDRTKFLIGDAAAVASEAGAVSKASKPKAAGKSGAVAKKAAAEKVGRQESRKQEDACGQISCGEV
jgi:hypothetical protein